MKFAAMFAWVVGVSAACAAPAAAGGAAGASDLADQLRERIGAALPAELAAFMPDDRSEIAAGRNVAASVLAVAPLVDDPDLQRYVNLTGRWVAAQSERADLPWRFGVIDTEAVNAFAVPGGYVLVTRGLYAVLEEPSELAGVLAHEIAHVTARHHLKMAASSEAIAAGLKRITGSLEAHEEEMAQHLVGAGASLLARKLDRHTEFEADRMAVVLAARAGFDPWGLPSVLTKLALMSAADDRIAMLFRTHPQPNDRLGQLALAMNDHLAPYGGFDAGGGLQVMHPH